jgi:hypothetical protein
MEDMQGAHSIAVAVVCRCSSLTLFFLFLFLLLLLRSILRTGAGGVFAERARNRGQIERDLMSGV